MRRVIEEEVVLTDREKHIFSSIDFADTFATTNHEHSLEEICHLIFNNPPNWVKSLFSIRNKVVKIFGLKHTLPEDFKEAFEVGGYVSFFKIFERSKDYVVMGADDSHLKFRAIIKKTSTPYYNIKVITLVEYNNMLGKVYMIAIKPFHKWVLKAMVKKGWAPTTK